MKIVVFIFSMILFLLVIDQTLDESHDLEVTRHRIGQEKGVGPGLRIAQISDLHVVGGADVEEQVIREVKREDPDLIVLTGDILPFRDRQGVLKNFLKRLGDRARIVAIPGNWEYFSEDNIKGLRDFYASCHVTLLINESLLFGDQPGRQILLVGLDDVLLGRPDWVKAVAWHRDWRGPVLILAHNPATVDLLSEKDPLVSDSVVLSGHTHGGQIVLFGKTVKATGLQNKNCLSGWCRDRGMAMYVSRGVGTSVIPLRIGAKPELALFEWIW